MKGQKEGEKQKSFVQKKGKCEFYLHGILFFLF